MLHFFRRFQRYIFLMITVVIVISFSFFGTYSTMMGPSLHEQPAFHAVDGEEISRGEVDQLAHFIGTDSEDKLMFGGMWGPNFLNDGVIRKDFLETGLANILEEKYQSDLKTDLQSRLDKEKRYAPYSHPQAKFLNAEGAWGYFAPNIKEGLALLRSSQRGEDPAAFAARVKLFLAERRFPAPALRQVLRYQEQQYNWIEPDANLDRLDLSIFGYHTTEDWFGPRFVKLVSQFIINSAKIAEQKGYRVSNEEALVDLLRNAEASFQLNRMSPYLGVASAQEYYQEQLHRMNIDQTQAVALWKQVLLFRRLFQDVGNAVFVDPFEYEKFEQFAKESVEGDLYRLPAALHFATYKELQQFEVYLDAVSKRQNPLSLPATFLTVAEVEKQTPELVQKRYLLEISEYNKKNLQSKVGLKETWNWEVENGNWETLKKKFPELDVKKATTREERLAILDALDDKTRSQIDTVARLAIVDAHPEWLQEALSEAKSKKVSVGLRGKESKTPFAGLENSAELMKLLDAAPMGEGSQIDGKLSLFTADQNSYYRIRVIDRAPQKEILTYAEAVKDGVLDKLLKKKLEADYQQLALTRPQEFQKADKSLKELAEVQDVVADHYFAKLLAAIKADEEKNRTAQDKAPVYNGDYYASHRLVSYVRDAKNMLQRTPEAATSLYQEPKEDVVKDHLAPREDLKDQWKLEKVPYRIDRAGSALGETLPAADTLLLDVDQWSKVYTFPNGEVAFFQLKAKKNLSTPATIANKMDGMQKLLSYDAQRLLMTRVLQDIQDKQAMSLEYLNVQ